MQKKRGVVFFLGTIALAYGAPELSKKIEFPATKNTLSILGDPTQDLRLSPYPRFTLVGNDVWLRPLFPWDWPGLVPILANPEKMQYYGLGHALSQEVIKDIALNNARKNLEIKDLTTDIHSAGKIFSWSFFTHKGFSGRIQVLYSQKDSCLELVYCGQGGTEKASILALTSFRGKKCQATVHPENKRSIKILKNLGFIPDKDRKAVKAYGSTRDYYVKNSQEEDVIEVSKKSPSLPLN
jgi:hypothetical protein